MAYKNTETNSSAQGAFYQWNYFSQALGKIGTASGATPNITVKDVQPEKETDWLRAIGDGIRLGNAGYEAFQEASYKEADEYFKTHSLEEYSAEMKANKIPFQWNPVAMAHLKYNHGKEVFNVATLDFQARVQAGDFNKMSPEEVQREYYKTVIDARDQLRDTFDYATPEDKYFNLGLFEGSPENRLRIAAEHIKVVSADKIKQNLVSSKTELINIFTDKSIPLEEKLEKYNQIYEIASPNLSAEGQLLFAKTMFESLSGVEGSEEDIKRLSEMEVKGHAGLTYKELLGEDYILAKMAESRTIAINKNAEAERIFNTDIRIKALAGDYAGLKLMHDEESKRSGGVLTEHHKAIQSAMDLALSRQIQAKKEAKTKEYTMSAQQQSWTESQLYLFDLMNDTTNAVSLDNIRYAKANKTAIDQMFHTLITDGIVVGVNQDTGEPIVKKWGVPEILEMASKTNLTYNPAQNYIDTYNKQALSDLRDLQTKLLDPKYNWKVPESITTVLTMMRHNEGAFMSSSLDTKDYWDLQGLYTIASTYGADAIRPFATGFAKWNELDEKDRVKYRSAYISNPKSSQGLTDIGVMGTWYQALGTHVRGNSLGFKLDAQTLELTQKTFFRNNQYYRGTAIPKTWLHAVMGRDYDILPLDTFFGGKGDFSNTLEGLVAERFKDGRYESQKIKLEDLECSFDFDDGLIVKDSTGMPLFTIAPEAIKDRAEAFSNELLNKRIMDFRSNEAKGLMTWEEEYENEYG